MLGKKTSLVVAVAVYFFGVFIYTIFVYVSNKSNLIEQVDNQLKMAAIAAESIFGESFHDNLHNQSSVSKAEDIALAKRMTSYARAVDVEYIYSLKKFADGKIRFTSSSATREEEQNNTYEIAYFTDYPEIPAEALAAFTTMQTQYAEYKDRWGKMRSIFIPKKTNTGEIYLVGADIPIDRVNAIVLQASLSALLAFLFLAVIVIPLINLFILALHKSWRAKYAALFKDELTGLSNRRQLIKDLQVSKNTHLILININRFKSIMMNYGPTIGDEVLKQFAYRLANFKSTVVKEMKAYRLYADNFAALIDQKLSRQEIKEVYRQGIKCLIRHPYLISADENLQIDVTAGAVMQNEDAFNLAEMALTEARRRNVRVVTYGEENKIFPEIYKQNIKLITGIKHALDGNRLVAYKQAIVKAKTFEVGKYELLARIVDEQGQVILGPDVFLPFARKARVYYRIIQKMLTEAIKLAKQNNCSISINICVEDITNRRTRQFIYDRLVDSGVSDKIEFEILENEVIDEYSQIINFIKRVKSYGASVGIDDVGKDHSNFERLAKLPVDFIKIDRSVMKYVAGDKQALSVIKEMIQLARNNQLKVCAEFCENKEIVDAAVALGVDYLQGYYFSLPEPVNSNS